MLAGKLTKCKPPFEKGGFRGISIMRLALLIRRASGDRSIKIPTGPPLEKGGTCHIAFRFQRGERVPWPLVFKGGNVYPGPSFSKG
jgi:hypothetical protein